MCVKLATKIKLCYVLIPRFASLIGPEKTRRKPKRRKRMKDDVLYICIDFHLIGSEIHNFSRNFFKFSIEKSIFLNSFYYVHMYVYVCIYIRLKRLCINIFILTTQTKTKTTQLRSHSNFKKTQLQIFTRFKREIPFFCFSFIETFSY